MTWDNDSLAPVETMLFRSKLVKVGSFDCDVEDPCFPVSSPLDNDVFVLPQRPVWIRRNGGDYRFVEPGAILMHRAGSTLERRCESDNPDRTFWFGVHPEVFLDALRRYDLSSLQMGGAIIIDPLIRYRLALLLKQLECQPIDRLAIEEDVLSLFCEVCERRARQEQKSLRPERSSVRRQRRLVDKARACLDRHLAENIGLETVAEVVGTSLYHLCRVFHEQTGTTMHAYRTGQRLGNVVARLVDGEPGNLTELALDSGFASHSHLSRVFRKQLGMPPSAMRTMG